jgi:hypothetical protein
MEYNTIGYNNNQQLINVKLNNSYSNKSSNDNLSTTTNFSNDENEVCCIKKICYYFNCFFI